MRQTARNQISYRLLALFLAVMTLSTSAMVPAYATSVEPEEEETFCGMEAHTHVVEECYKEQKTLTCELEEDLTHTHVATCFWEEKQLICTQKVQQPHTHEDACYKETKVLVCTLEEDPSVDVYKVDNDVQPVGHIHGYGCYVLKRELICGKEATAGHAHGEACYKTKTTQLCSSHLHGEDCYTVEKKLTCERLEHTHTEECYLPELEYTELLSKGVVVSGQLPVGAELAVQKFSEAERSEIPVDENEQVVFAYDISIMLGGEDYQPEDSMEVIVELQEELPEGVDYELTVWHISDNGTMEAVESQLNGNGTATFIANGFSVYVGILTVEAPTTDGKIGDYIYFDLAAGNVTINGSTYTGYIYKDTDTKVTVTGTYSDENQYYIYQSNASNRAETGLIGDKLYLPEYDRVEYDGEDWGDYITDNTSPTDVAKNWTDAAEDVDRSSTDNYVTLSGNGTYDITIDNLWSTKNESSTSRRTGGIAYVAPEGGKAFIRMKGDNRFGNIHYSYGGGTDADEDGFVNGTGIVFEDGEPGSDVGTVTVVSYNGKNNHYNSVIGGNDSGTAAYESSCGIIINSGVVYAGARADSKYTGSSQVDNCSAIGGGGNGTGVVTINGGTVTAVVSSTGAAIGGGIGESNVGGKGYVTITGGEVYAYNFGYVTFSNKVAYPVPAAAIGGASSRDNVGSIGKVTISGGSVYALSVGGAAIGGGSSTKNNGGEAVVSISGDADVIARSIAGSVNGEDVDAGVSIGGGTGGSLGTGTGGNATLTVSGGNIETGSIGGGACTNATQKIGNAVVTISGGTVQGQVIMAKGAAAACKFTMTGGKLDNGEKTDDFVFLQDNGGAVYMDDPNGEAKISGGTIENCSAGNGGAVYMTAGTFTLSGTGEIRACEANKSGGAIYMGGGTCSISGGAIEACSAKNGGAVYLGGGTMTVSGGEITGNTASANGGGAYLGGGTMTVSGGEITGNTASTNGGGAYLSGGVLSISDGSISNNTAKGNGGGACVENGNVVMSGGAVDNNEAKGAGGGVYVAADGTDVSVMLYSGSVSGNSAGTSGGAVAVYGTAGGSEKITVDVGLREEHLYEDGKLIEINHSDAYGAYEHDDCPEIKNNESQTSGGGIYIKGGDNTALNIYCVTEAGNSTEESPLSNFMMIEGGRVVISCAENHPGEDETNVEGDDEHGNTNIASSVHVVGGKVDLYGAMGNPEFGNTVTVDVPSDGNAYFRDHRYNDSYYKLLYFENFLDPDTGIVSGQYTAYQIPFDGTHKILPVMYNHPGYEIDGWNTDAAGEDRNTNHSPTGSSDGMYLVGDTHVFDGDPIGNLTIFAIWDANGYTVEFDPNVPRGETYSGEMDDQVFTFNEAENLRKNKFEYPGHIFIGWEDEDGNEYEDGEEIYNLTDEDEATITLYAQWEECTHDPDESDCELTYKKIDSTTLERSCSCDGQTLWVTLSAEDTVYDGERHRADVDYDDPAVWDPEVTYTKEGDDSFSGVPVDAGTYTATVEDGGKSIEVTYTIDKAPQDPPETPVFTVVGNQLTVEERTSSKAAIDPEIVTYYQMFYYIGDEANSTEPSTTPVFTLEKAYTSYYVIVWYGKGENHYESEAIRSKQTLYYRGKTKIDFDVETGILYTPTEVTGGVQIKVEADETHYLTSAFLITDDNTTAEIEENQPLAQYILQNIPENEDLTIVVTITGAKKKTGVTAKVMEKQVFGTVSGTSAAISRDSAFTAYYTVSNYDAAVYSDVKLTFRNALPQGATVILLDKSNGSYWDYTAAGSKTEIGLEEFTRMGGTDPFTVSGTELKYQFIVDFSRTEAGCSGAGLTVSLAANKSDSSAPTLSGSVNVTLEDKSGFELAVSGEGLTQSLELNYAPSDGTVSKWDSRNMALILTPPDTVPADTTLLVTLSSGQKTDLPMSANGTYIIPLAAVGDDSLGVELKSKLLPIQNEDVTYQFTAKWVISNSGAAKAPANGDYVVSAATVSFEKAAEVVPSVRITGEKHLFTTSETLKVEVDYILPAGCTVTADLLRENANGGYSSTAWKQGITAPGEIRVPLDVQQPGEFCLMLVVERGLSTVLQVPYYFIIQ